MFPLFDLQVRMAQCATEVVMSGVTAAAAIANASLNAALRTAAQAGWEPAAPEWPSALPVKLTTDPGFPIFDPFSAAPGRRAAKAFPAFSPFEWPAAASSKPFPAVSAWTVHLWFLPLVNPFVRRRSAMEQMFDPLGLWHEDKITIPNPFAMPAQAAAASAILRSAAETIKNVQAAAFALMTPHFPKSAGFFPLPWLGA